MDEDVRARRSERARRRDHLWLTLFGRRASLARGVFRVFFLTALFALTLWFGYTIRAVLNPFLLALLIAYILHPAVVWVDDHSKLQHLGRNGATLVVFLGGFLLFGGLAAFATYQLIVGVEAFVSELSGNLDEIEAWLIERAERIPPEQVEAAIHWAQDNARSILETSGDALGWFGEEVLGRLFAVFSYAFLVPFYTFFLLKGMIGIRKTLSQHLPAMGREKTVRILRQMDTACSSFFRGRLLMAAGRTVFVAVGLSIVGVDFPILIAIISGALSIIPLVGTVIGFLIAIPLGYGSEWLFHIVGALIVFVLVEVLEALVAPYLLGGSAGLHPVSYILSLFIFGELFGTFGVIMAVPLAATVKILFNEFVVPEVKALAQEAQERSAAAAAEPAASPPESS